MATLDSLEPQRRAIIELLLGQGKGYDELAEMLDTPSERVRELALEALVSLAPGRARRVDDDWRAQVADYVLGEQAGPDARATRGHLKRSEPARLWVSSLVDSLDHLYGDGPRPDVPEPDGRGGARPPREAVGRRAAVPAWAPPATTAGGERRRGQSEDGDGQEIEADVGTATAHEPSAAGGSVAAPAVAPTPGPTTAPPGWEGQRTRGRSSGRRAAVRRRRLMGGALAAAAVVAALVLALALAGGGEEQDKGGSQPAESQGDQAQIRLLGQGQLANVGDGDAQGVAVIAERGGQTQLLVQARGLKPSGRRGAYEVWLYNSRRDAVSLGGQVADGSGRLQGAGPLPSSFRSYRLIDISREKIDRNAGHSGDSVLRVPVSDVLRGAAAAGAGDAGGAGAAPGGGAAP